jgi:hypothetical protein
MVGSIHSGMKSCANPEISLSLLNTPLSMSPCTVSMEIQSYYVFKALVAPSGNRAR